MIIAKMSPAMFAELSKKLRDEEGLELGRQSGTLQKNGVTAAYDYDGTRLRIDVTAKPFLVTKDFCEAKIRQALEEQGCATQ